MRMAELKAAGGNSMRGWGADWAEDELIAAQRLGLTYTIGIWLGHRSYFDYSSRQQNAKQKEMVQQIVAKHRNEPALLIWSLGNEMEQDNNDTADLWTAMEDLAKATKELDPNHPVMTVVAEVSQQKIDNIKKYAPSIDVLGINSYGGLSTLPKRLKEYGWTKPYIVTEFGGFGPWERPKTEWGAALELTSTEKADLYLNWYKSSIENQPQCLGGYAFLWGDKQEETPTWFGMYLPSGEKTAAVDTMSYLWTGKWPTTLAPKIKSFTLDVAQKEVAPGGEVHAEVVIDGPAAGLNYRWSLMKEVTDKRYAGEGEQHPGNVPGPTEGLTGPKVVFSVPRTPGAYRLCLTVTDGSGHGATANAPFLVRQKQQ